jgi:predicted dehydrogenase
MVKLLLAGHNPFQYDLICGAKFPGIPAIIPANEIEEKGMNRREFIKKLGGGIAGAGLGATFLPRELYAGGLLGQDEPAAAKKAVPPSERIVMALIGTGGMGGAHLNWFSGFDDVELVALCDVDSQRLGNARAALEKRRPGAKIDTCGDFRRILDRKDIDAVSIATPDHWHALIAIHAMLAGKDVYSEKPLSYTAAESRVMLAAQQKHERVFQLGTQIHAGENYHRVVELVRSGALGTIHTVRVWKTGGTPNIEAVPDEPAPEHLDWDMWLGPRPERAYNPRRCHFNFRYFWDYSGGHFADFWCHIADIAFWALDLGAPKTVETRGALMTRGMGETHEWIESDMEFEGIKFFWTTKIPDVPGAAGRGIGCCFQGDKGHLVTDYGSRKIYINGEEVVGDDLAEVERSIPRSPGHQRNFVDCVKSRALTESNLPYTYNMTLPMHLALAASWDERKLDFDAKAGEFIGSAKANEFLDKPMRAPWKLPKV